MSPDVLIQSDSAAEAERLNAWMRGQQVVQVGRYSVADSARSSWVVYVRTEVRGPNRNATGALVSAQADALLPKVCRLAALAPP